MQNQSLIFTALAEHARRSLANFHVPGHKQGRGLPPELSALSGRDLCALDVTELTGLDDLHRPQGIIAQAQALAAQAYGADRSFFLVNGSTVGVHALLLALGGGGKVLVPRHGHRSVLGGLILSGAEPEYLTPVVMERFGFAAGVESRHVSRALATHPDAAAFLTVRPNYYGVADNLARHAQIIHGAGKPLLVDEAHGAHLHFHPLLPADAMAAGADASVQSTHKTGGSLTQSAMLHLRKGMLDQEAVGRALDLLQTTSPSYLLLASLDLARRQMVLQGGKSLDETLYLAQETRRRISAVDGLTVLTEGDLPQGWSLDGTKLVIAVNGLGLTGYQVSDLLSRRYRIYVEMADMVNIIAFLSPATTRAECDDLAEALEDIARRDRLPAAQTKNSRIIPLPNPVRRMKPRDAWFAAAQSVLLTDAGGRISAEMAAVYPPGIPVLYPGEEITSQVQEYLYAVRKLGLPCHGPADGRLKTVRVVIE